MHRTPAENVNKISLLPVRPVVPSWQDGLSATWVYLRTAPVLNAWPYSLRKWQPAPVFLLWKSHEQRSLAGYSPWGCKESDTTERLSTLEPELEIFQLCQSAAWESLKNISLVVLVSPLVSLQPYLSVWHIILLCSTDTAFFF